MRKIIPVLLSAMVTTSLLVQNVCAAPALPDLFDIISSAASDVLEAAGNAGANISDAAAQTGETVTGAAKQVGELTSEVVSNVGKSVSEFSAQAGNVFADWSVQAQTTAEEVQKKLTKAGIDLQTNASAWGKATTANGHTRRPAGPPSPVSQSHIRRPGNFLM